jgi:hypothetical protein
MFVETPILDVGWSSVICIGFLRVASNRGEVRLLQACAGLVFCALTAYKFLTLPNQLFLAEIKDPRSQQTLLIRPAPAVERSQRLTVLKV